MARHTARSRLSDRHMVRSAHSDKGKTGVRGKHQDQHSVTSCTDTRHECENAKAAGLASCFGFILNSGMHSHDRPGEIIGGGQGYSLNLWKYRIVWVKFNKS